MSPDNPVPLDVPEADYLDQHAAADAGSPDATPAAADLDGIELGTASEADLFDQRTVVPLPEDGAPQH